jgi:hypothetical protein
MSKQARGSLAWCSVTGVGGGQDDLGPSSALGRDPVSRPQAWRAGPSAAPRGEARMISENVLDRLLRGPARGLPNWPAMMPNVRKGFVRMTWEEKFPYVRYGFTGAGLRRARGYRPHGAGK